MFESVVPPPTPIDKKFSMQGMFIGFYGLETIQDDKNCSRCESERNIFLFFHSSAYNLSADPTLAPRSLRRCLPTPADDGKYVREISNGIKTKFSAERREPYVIERKSFMYSAHGGIAFTSGAANSISFVITKSTHSLSAYPRCVGRTRRRKSNAMR